MIKDAALLIVDVQNDFCPGGALAVQGGDRVVDPLNRIAAYFAGAGALIVASRDWHPEVTTHFRDFGGVWPVHCVQETLGAAFHPALQLPAGTTIVSKGCDPENDAYSAFDGVGPDGASLADMLIARGVRHLYVGGLATDYCVRSSALDARKAGFDVTVLLDAVAGVDLVAGDSDKALDDMKSAGINVSRSEAILNQR